MVFVLCLVTFYLVGGSAGFIYDSDYSKTIKENEEYFGYSVFMQLGSPNKLIVGAPKSGLNRTGTIIVYEIDNDGNVISKKLYTLPIDEDRPNIRADNLFGASIGGGIEKNEPIMVCAPKYTLKRNVANGVHYFANGACYTLDVIENNRDYGFYPNSEPSEQIGNSIYQYAFGEFGHSISYYKNGFLMGSPGDFQWQGGAITVSKQIANLPPQTRQLYGTTEVLQTKHLDKHIFNDIEKDSYTGYSVAAGEFIKDQNNYVIGIPRANDLKGLVYILSEGRIWKILDNDYLGSYFGSSLCVLDVNGDGLDDLLVGAPLYSKGNLYNMGAVILFINKENGDFEQKPTIFSKTKTTGEQFGMTMANLGKITLDSTNGVAISSPYYKGQGAIFIYYGTYAGDLIYSQTITMSGQKGFGYSLSRGVDFSANKIQDIVVGAYESKTVTLLKAKDVFYFQSNITQFGELYSYKENNKLEFIICIWQKEIGSVDANIKINLDGRMISDDLGPTQIKVKLNDVFCKRFHTDLKKEMEMQTPLKIKWNIKEIECTTCPIASPKSKNAWNYEVPFLLECPNQICIPKIKIDSNFNKNEVVVGKDKIFDLNIKVVNSKDPAYGCKLTVGKPNQIFENNPNKHCTFDRKTIQCKLDNILKTEQVFTFTFDASNLGTGLTSLTFPSLITCTNYSINSTESITLKYETVLLVTGRTDDVIYRNNNNTANSIGTFSFYIKNTRSPIQNHEILFKIPKKLKNLEDKDIFYIAKPKIDDNSKLTCESQIYDDLSTIDDVKLDNLQALEEAPEKIHYLDDKIVAMEIVCKLKMKHEDETKISFDVKPNISEIMSQFKTTFIVVSGATYFSEYMERITESTLNYKDTNLESVNVWIWIVVGVVVGLLLLSGVIFLFYKCNFFRRKTHEQLQEELESNKDGVELEESTLKSEYE